MFALFENLGGVELVIVLVAALLIFGKRLPEVASQAGSTISKFKRNLDSAIRDSGVEREIRKIKEALPTDLSISDVARAAARKMEDRLLDAAQVNPPAPAAPDVKPSEASLADPRPTPPNEGAPIETVPIETVPNEIAPTEHVPTPGVDPAKNFSQPGSVPRE